MGLDGDISFYSKHGKGRLLDIGCNEGRGLPIYKTNGFVVEGLEVNELAAAKARKGYAIRLKNYQRNNSFAKPTVKPERIEKARLEYL